MSTEPVDLAAMSDRDLMILAADIAAERVGRSKGPPAERWDPWSVLARLPDVRLRWWEFPADDDFGAVVCTDADGTNARILVGSRVTWAELPATLTHELIHLERGLAEWTPAERAAEEAEVRRITAERMHEFEPVPLAT